MCSPQLPKLYGPTMPLQILGIAILLVSVRVLRTLCLLDFFSSYLNLVVTPQKCGPILEAPIFIQYRTRSILTLGICTSQNDSMSLIYAVHIPSDNSSLLSTDSSVLQYLYGYPMLYFTIMILLFSLSASNYGTIVHIHMVCIFQYAGVT